MSPHLAGWQTVAPALFLLLQLSSCGKGDAAEGGKPGSDGPLPVEVARPLIEPLVEWDKYTGRIAPVEEVIIQAQVSGYLESLHFKGGQVVEEGDLLAVIDSRTFDAEVVTAKARVKEAEAQKTRAQAMLAQAQALVEGEESSLELARTMFRSAKDALTKNAIAREQVDMRDSEVSRAVAQAESARASVALAEAEIASAEASIAVNTAALDRAELELSYTRITAPIAGRVSDRLVTRGNFIQSGLGIATTTLTTIVSQSPVHVNFDANEQEFLKYVRLSKSGDRASSRDVKNPVLIALVDEEGYPHRGHMDFVDNQLDTDTGTIRGRAIFRNDDGILTPGLFATVRLPGTARYDAVLIPDEAILSRQASQFVYVLDENNAAEIRNLKLGPIVDQLRVVRSGLDEDDRVIVNGIQKVKPGDVVEPKEVTIEIERSADGLPNDYQPVPRSEWISEAPEPMEPAEPIKPTNPAGSTAPMDGEDR